MSKNYFISAFGTFGNPNGFKQSFWFTNDRNVVSKIRTFDLNSNAIKLFPKSKVYSIRKEYANGLNTISYSIYTYAKEQNSDRSGTFIGSSILYLNKIANEHITIKKLNEFHNKLENKNVLNETITVNHSDRFSIEKPSEFDQIELHLRDIENLNFRQNTDNYLVVFCSINDNSLNQLFEKSIDLLNVYDTIFFTDSPEVAEFVRQKGIFKLIQNAGDKRDFEKEVDALIEENKRKKEKSISEFDKEIQMITDEKNNSIEGFKKEIEQIEKKHRDNEIVLNKSKADIINIEQYYDEFLNKTNSLKNQLKQNNGKLEEVRQIHNNNKIIFNNGISELKRQNNYVTTIAKPKPKGSLHTQNYYQETEKRRVNDERERVDKKDHKINNYKLTNLILIFLLSITWIYFLFFNSNNEDKLLNKKANYNEEQLNSFDDQTSMYQTQTNNKANDDSINQISENKLENLNPIPNSLLNFKDLKTVSKYIKYNTEINKIVEIIFNKNPTEIKNIYKGQEDLYSKHLIERNKECFELKNDIYYFTKDTLRKIPSFSK